MLQMQIQSLNQEISHLKTLNEDLDQQNKLNLMKILDL